ncbi:helix-turn-helix domain-containing protein [Rhizobium viscosum]|uniref:AraC-like DNA-binding protein n=1 Tax=Rhizobium viscosum TaxID=1673 RepID=A0ABR9IVH2_RHIVS|nr:helix-turn-helix domain-containing protein [Rhizobium viscosum]MBE1507199.1 AraC-like DNA-binding protein [Rhizobium viscosum]
MELAESKVVGKPVYQPGASTIEGMPMALQMFYAHPPVMAMPHWHAQVEVNYIMRGSVHYRMNDHDIRLEAGQMCLFWGGQPHQMNESSDDSLYAGAHLPLVYFFKMRLPPTIGTRLMKGEILLTSSTDAADEANFPRWYDYARSGDPRKTQHAVDELLLRIERIALDSYSMVPENIADELEQPNAQLSRSVARMCDFIASNFLQDIDTVEIARAVDLHPKYAMNLFKKTTGMTISKYLNLLRLSHAQAQLMGEGSNVLQIAMDSGFGSISAFNKSFRNIAGMSPSDFRRDIRSVIGNISVAG